MPLETGKGKGVGKAGFYVPTIDIRPFLDDPSSVAAGEVVEMVRDACVSTGFFQTRRALTSTVTGHGIPAALQEAVFAGSRAFFALDGEEKKRLDKSRSVGASNRGYEGIGNQGLQEGALPDLKEGFYIGLETPASDPRVLAHAFKMMGPNLWPPLPLTTFHDPMTAYYTAIYALSLRILDIVASTLTLPRGNSHAHVRAREAREFFHEFTSNDPVASIRLLHYPPAPATGMCGDGDGDGDGQMGAGAHTDFGALTLLLQDGVGGLQVWNSDELEQNAKGKGKGKGEWVDVKPQRDAYVVNVGDMLEMVTAGRYRSGLHRVVNRGGRDRYSVPFFFDGNVECVLRPLGGGEKEGEGKGEGEKWVTVEEHLRERFGSTYGRREKREDGVEIFNA